MRPGQCKAHLASGLFAVLSMVQAEALAQQPSEDPLALGPRTDEHPVKYAISSAAWSVNSNAGLRIVAHNRGDENVTLHSVVFQTPGSGDDTELDIDLEVPAGAWAETAKPYIDLLSGNNCVEETLREDWRLKEISNYTLNPSVRGLIIEDTRSFRIFQCVREVRLSWDDEQNERQTERQWVMYHFERLPFD
ncbi:MAG: hypothetical protein WEB57_01985 [Pseudohongiellaceae bacterium]